MKHCRLFAIALILVLISSPAIAAMCAAKCAGGELTSAMQAEHPVTASSSHHCQQPDDQSDKHQQHAEHKSCNMAGCHISASAAFIASAQFMAADFSHSVSAYFTSSALNAELPPPIKPPA